jgi:aryl-alcohol dehydrogenase-like predicted oxidoreductase
VRVGFSTSGPAQSEVIERALQLRDSPFSAVQATWNLLEPSAGPALEAANEARWLVVVKEVLANGRLTGGGNGQDAPDARDHRAEDAEARDAEALADADGQPLEGLAVGAAVAQSWADIVLSGAVTRAQLRGNTRARVPALPQERLTTLARPAPEYWAARSARSWG